MQAGETCIEAIAAANSLYLRSFEDWVSASIRCESKGLTEQDRIARLKNSYRRAIKSNIAYHELVAKTESDMGNKDSAALHSAMAKAYPVFMLD